MTFDKHIHINKKTEITGKLKKINKKFKFCFLFLKHFF